MGIDLHLSTCVDTQSPKYLEMAQRHISLSVLTARRWADGTSDSEQSLSGAHRIVRCTVRCAVQCATKIPLGNLVLSGFCVGKPFPWASLAPPSRGHTGQSGAHRTVRCPKARNPVSVLCCFPNRFLF
jgi:hypothetical protein